MQTIRTSGQTSDECLHGLVSDRKKKTDRIGSGASQRGDKQATRSNVEDVEWGREISLHRRSRKIASVSPTRVSRIQVQASEEEEQEGQAIAKEKEQNFCQENRQKQKLKD